MAMPYILILMVTHGHHSAAPTQSLRGNEWRAVGVLLPHLLAFRGRVALALSLLVAAKLANVGVPLIMKEIVDKLNPGLDPRLAVVAVPLALLAAYGLLRFSTTLFGELRDVVFVRVRIVERQALKLVLLADRPVQVEQHQPGLGVLGAAAGSKMPVLTF